MASGVNFGAQKYYGFDPRNIPGCVLWLDAADSRTITGNPVTTWRDKSPSGSNATSASGPTVSGNTLVFNGTSSTMASAITLPTGTHTLFAAHNPFSSVKNISLIRFQAAASASYISFPYYGIAPRGYVTSYDSTTIDNANSTLLDNSVAGSSNIITAVIDLSAQSTYLNGVQQATTSATITATTSASLTIGSSNGTSAFYQGSLGEVILYNYALSSDQRQQVEGYLGWKWGLSSSLPTTTSYKLTRPLMRTANPADVGPLMFWWDAAAYSTIAVSSGTVGAGGTVSSWTDRASGLALTVPATFVGPVSTSNGISFTNVSGALSAGVSQILHYSNATATWTMSQSTTMIVASAPNRFDLSRNVFTLQAPQAFNVNPSFLMDVQVGASEGNTVGAWDGSATWLSLQRAAAVNTGAGNGRVDSLLSAPSNFAWTNGTENTYSISNVSRGTAVAGTASITGMVIGGTTVLQPNRAYDGLVYEILVYGSNLPAYAIRQVEGYLAWKWKFPRNLVSTHPFYSLPPSTATPVNSAPMPSASANNSSFITKYNSSGVIQWNARVGGGGTVFAYGAYADPTGNLYAVVQYYTTSAVVNNADGSSFGSYPFTAGIWALVIKYTPDGLTQWVARMSATSGSINLVGVTGDSAGNVYVCASYNPASLILYNSDGTTFGTMGRAGSFDVGVIKYNASGFVQWSAHLGGTGVETAGAVCVDSTGNLYVDGFYASPTLTAYNSDGTTFATTLSLVGTGSDAFVAKYDSSGFVQWIARIGGTVSDYAYGIASDPSGNVLVSGRYQSNPISFYNSDGTAFGTTLAMTGASLGYVVKYNSTGFVQWAARIGSTGAEYGYSVLTDSSGNVYVCGDYTANPVTFYSSNGTAFGTTLSITGAQKNAYIVKYDASGIVQWCAKIGGGGPDTCQSVSLDSSGNAYVVGYAGTSPVTIYNANASTFGTLAFSGTQAGFVVKYNSSGTVQWATRTAGSTVYGRGSSTDTNGNVFAVGDYSAGAMNAYSQGQ